jgi:PadR family transcriptional regulator PadR
VPRPVHLGEFELFVLSGLLMIEDGPSALRLREELHRLTGRWVSRGALYRTLDRLEQKGYVASGVEQGGPGRHGHLRRLFTVTKTGKAALRASRNAMMRMWDEVAEVLQ